MNQSQNSKNILIVAHHLSTGGMPQFLLKKIQALLSEDNVNVFLIEIQDVTGGKFIVQREQIIDLLRDRFFSINNDYNLFIRLIDAIKPNNIHFEEFVEFFLPDNISNQIFIDNRTYTISETTHDSGFDPSHKRFFPDSWQFVSKYTEKRYKHYNIPIQVIEYPIQKKPVTDRKQGLEKLGLDPNKFHVLNVGLFTNRKNQKEIVEYAKTIKADGYNDIVFHFVGNLADNFQDYWKPIVENLPDNCVIWGERKDVDSFYSCMDLFLFTSLGNPQDLETNPLVIKEALSWDMNVFLYNLPVYENKFNYEPNVTLLSNDKSKNLDLILDEFKKFKNLKFKTKNIDLEGTITKNEKYFSGEFLNNDIVIFSHYYLVNNWESVLNRQLDKIRKNDLYDQCKKIYFGVYSDNQENLKTFQNIINLFDYSNKVEIINHKENNFEYDTLKKLKSFVDFNSDINLKILYFHSKGVSRNNESEEIKSNIRNWVEYLEFFNIELWEKNIENLNNGYDTSGALWIKYEPDGNIKHHYSGNFWWANSTYLRRLNNLEDSDIKNRINHELWIGTKKPNFFNFYTNVQYSKDDGSFYCNFPPKEIWINDDNISNLIKKNKIAVFSHNFLKNDWRPIVETQLKKLLDSELYNYSDYIFYCVYSETENDFYDFSEMVKSYDPIKKIEIVRYLENKYEYPTLKLIHDFSKNSSEDINILYYHTKGVSLKDKNHNYKEEMVFRWRDCLEYYTIENWKFAISVLQNGIDITGPLYFIEEIKKGFDYFCGNFWWGRSNYLNKLNPPKDPTVEGDLVDQEHWCCDTTNKSFYSLYWWEEAPLVIDLYNEFPKDYKSPRENEIKKYKNINKIEKGIVMQNELNSHLIAIGYISEENKIIIDNLSNQKLSGKFVVREMDYHLPIYASDFSIDPGLGLWIIPIPSYLVKFTDLKDFNGFKIELYNSNNELIVRKDLRIANHEFDPTGFKFDYVNPYDCLFNNWQEFFVYKIYDPFFNGKVWNVGIDIGANQGVFTKLMIDKGFKKIYSIDPVESNYQALSRLSKIYDNITPLKYAVSDTDRVDSFYIDNDNTTISSLDYNHVVRVNPSSNIHKDSVTVKKLDTIINENNLDEIDFIKIDVEGAEYQIIESASPETLNKIKTFIIEWHNNFDLQNNKVDKMIQKLTQNGFSILTRKMFATDTYLPGTQHQGTLDTSTPQGIVFAYRILSNV